MIKANSPKGVKNIKINKIRRILKTLKKAGGKAVTLLNGRLKFWKDK